MHPRVAEIDQDAIAHVFRDKAVEPRDDLGDGAVIRANDLAQIFGIELRRERGRADEIAEHHRELAALRSERAVGAVLLCDLGSSSAGPRGLVSQYRNGGKEFPAVAYRTYANGDQIVGGEVGQHLGIDIIVAECRRVLLKPQTVQPRLDVHGDLGPAVLRLVKLFSAKYRRDASKSSRRALAFNTTMRKT